MVFRCKSKPDAVNLCPAFLFRWFKHEIRYVYNSFFGWVVILILGSMLVLLMCCLLFFLNKISKNHTIKTSFFEVTAKEQQKDLFMAEGKDQLDNQCQIAKQILKEIRVMLYECMVRKFNVTDKKNIAIIELITYRIVDRLNYEVKNDLTRNHITKKLTRNLNNILVQKHVRITRL